MPPLLAPAGGTKDTAAFSSQIASGGGTSPKHHKSGTAGGSSSAVCSEGVMVAMASEDPLDRADFDPIAYLNHLFPTERSLDR